MQQTPLMQFAKEFTAPGMIVATAFGATKGSDFSSPQNWAPSLVTEKAAPVAQHEDRTLSAKSPKATAFNL